MLLHLIYYTHHPSINHSIPHHHIKHLVVPLQHLFITGSTIPLPFIPLSLCPFPRLPRNFLHLISILCPLLFQITQDWVVIAVYSFNFLLDFFLDYLSAFFFVCELFFYGVLEMLSGFKALYDELLLLVDWGLVVGKEEAGFATARLTLTMWHRNRSHIYLFNWESLLDYIYSTLRAVHELLLPISIHLLLTTFDSILRL